MTTMVEFVTSLRVGQVTLRISRYTLFMYSIILFNMFFFFWQAWRDSNPQPPGLEPGALPLELQAYFVSLWVVCLRQNGQYFLISRRSCFFLFFVVV
jgi:hypothetical protein